MELSSEASHFSSFWISVLSPEDHGSPGHTLQGLESVCRETRQGFKVGQQTPAMTFKYTEDQQARPCMHKGRHMYTTPLQCAGGLVKADAKKLIHYLILGKKIKKY